MVADGEHSQHGEQDIRAVVVPESVIMGSRLAALETFEQAGVKPVSVITHRRRLEGRFRDLQLAIGDIIYLRGTPEAINAIAEQAGLLLIQAPEDTVEPGRADWSVPIGFGGAVLVAAFGLLRPELAFAGAIVLLAVFGRIDIAKSLHRMNWPIIILLAVMIPLGSAVETTGTASLIAGEIAGFLVGHGVIAVIFSILASAVLITPFVNNASTAIVLAPIALQVAVQADIDPRLALIAVGVGVSLDFLTPFGHHNNTIVMGVGGYRFIDFARLGLPVLVAAVAALLLTSALML